MVGRPTIRSDTLVNGKTYGAWPSLTILVWDGTGLVLTYKRLEVGKFVWPQVRDGVMRLSPAQYQALFEGLDWRRMTARRVREPAVAN